MLKVEKRRGRRGNLAAVNVDVRNKITEAIINLKTVKDTKPSAKKIFSYLWKSDEELELVLLQSYLDKLVEDKYLQTKGSNSNKTLTIAKIRHTSECEATITEYLPAKQTFDEPNEKLTNETRHDLHYQSEFSRPLVKSVFNGTITISSLGPRIWDVIPLEMKQKESLTAFKKAIKTRNPRNCSCGLCKCLNAFSETPYTEG